MKRHPVVAIASGKGGTGKTTIATCLAASMPGPVALLDCDVEAPNAHLFLNVSRESGEVVMVPVPEVDEARCDACGECGRFCAYHAIVTVGAKPLVFPELCHGCGGCRLVCPRQAIRETGHRIGEVERLVAGDILLIQGRLEIASPLAPPLVRAVKERLPQDRPVVIDAPPGTACPVVAAVRGVDHVVLVSEPTAFGLHDLELAVAMVRELALPCGVVVNRVGIGDRRVHEFCSRERIPLFAAIPDDRRIAEAYANGRLPVAVLPEYRELFLQLAVRCGLGEA